MLSVRVKKSFGAFSLDVSFEAEDGALALLGASGCGKSMTLKCIAGIIKPDYGRIILNGRILFDSEKKINLAPQKRNTGLLFQNYALFPSMTVEENIAAGLRAKTRPPHNKRVDELLETFYLTKERRRYPAELSGGQQQRTALARIIASKPELLMLDEPLSALDSFLRWQLERELIELAGKFLGTILYVSHNRDEVFRLSKNVCVIADGKNEAPVPVKTFFNEPKTKTAALLSGCKNFSRAKKTGASRVFAETWNCELECAAVPDNILHIGVRAHHIVFGAAAASLPNKIECVVKKIIGDLFGTIIIVAPRGIQTAQSELRVETAVHGAEHLREGEILEIGIAPNDILFLVDS